MLLLFTFIKVKCKMKKIKYNFKSGVNTMYIAVMGCGVVGSGVVELIEKNGKQIAENAVFGFSICVDLVRHRPLLSPGMDRRNAARQILRYASLLNGGNQREIHHDISRRAPFVLARLCFAYAALDRLCAGSAYGACPCASALRTPTVMNTAASSRQHAYTYYDISINQ